MPHGNIVVIEALLHYTVDLGVDRGTRDEKGAVQALNVQGPGALDIGPSDGEAADCLLTGVGRFNAVGRGSGLDGSPGSRVTLLNDCIAQGDMADFLFCRCQNCRKVGVRARFDFGPRSIADRYPGYGPDDAIRDQPVGSLKYPDCRLGRRSELTVSDKTELRLDLLHVVAVHVTSEGTPIGGVGGWDKWRARHRATHNGGDLPTEIVHIEARVGLAPWCIFFVTATHHDACADAGQDRSDAPPIGIHLYVRPRVGVGTIRKSRIFSLDSDEARIARSDALPAAYPGVVGASGGNNVIRSIATKAELGEWSRQIWAAVGDHAEARHIPGPRAGGMMADDAANDPDIAMPTPLPIRLLRDLKPYV